MPINSVFKDEVTDKLFHIDDPPSSFIDPRYKPKQTEGQIADPICALCCSNSTLIVARASGSLYRYSLPSLNLSQKYVLRCRPQSMALNCNSTRLSVVDVNGILILFDLDGREDGSKVGLQLKFERKDIWDLIWSNDNPELFACMEKARMYVIRGINPEEPGFYSLRYYLNFSRM